VSTRSLLLTKESIAAVIPHAGEMCLLDGVVKWDAESIRCVSASYGNPDNPLRSHGRLSTISSIEYAAQAMAVHGALAGTVGSAPRAGYLASVRDVICRCRDLDNLVGELTVDARRLFGDGDRVLYEFTLRVGDTEVLSGRAAVVLDASGAVP
jgi:predicted hotdog family 3-hydroxylacyl-ACP dehydratase